MKAAAVRLLQQKERTMTYEQEACFEEPLPGILHRHQIVRNLLAGVFTAEIAALIMAAVMMAAFTISLGKNPLFPVQVIGSFILGGSVIETLSAKAVVAGLALHLFGPTLFWGVVFGVFINLLNVCRGTTLFIIGLGIGIMSQIADASVVSGLFTLLHGHNIWAENVPLVWSWAAHLVFGVSLGLYPIMYRWVVERY